MKYHNIQKEKLKNKVAQNYFCINDCSKIICNVNFCVCMHNSQRTTLLVFSADATAVLYAGRKLLKYNHKQLNCNVNASLYDIKEHFQSKNKANKVNNISSDDTYFIEDLKEKHKQHTEKLN